MTRFFLLSLPVLLFAVTVRADIVGESVEYQSGDQTCEGWHAYDNSLKGSRPSILIVHQWTGLTDYEKMRSKMLAELGYNVFALDIYGKGIRPQPPEAGEWAGKFKGNRDLYRQRLKDGLNVLLGFPQTDKDKLAAIGYCFGGTGVLELARSGADIEGVVSFHGGLGTPTPEDAKNIKCPVLALHGADDPFVNADEVAGFEQEMKAAYIDYTLIKYPGAVHAFTQKMAGNDNSKGAAYNAEADKMSWGEMKKFFGQIFG